MRLTGFVCISNYMWTAANIIIEGRMQPYGRRLCTVALLYLDSSI